MDNCFGFCIKDILSSKSLKSELQLNFSGDRDNLISFIKNYKFLQNHRCGKPQELGSQKCHPGLCKHHGDLLNVNEHFRKLQPIEKELITILSAPRHFNIAYLQIFAEENSFSSMGQLASLIICKSGFWVLSDVSFFYIIRLGYKHIVEKNNIQMSMIEDNFRISYAYLVDYIMDIMPFLLDNGELVEELKITKEEMRIIKINLLVKYLFGGFMVSNTEYGPTLPKFTKDWQDTWKQRFANRISTWNTKDKDYVINVFNNILKIMEVVYYMCEHPLEIQEIRELQETSSEDREKIAEAQEAQQETRRVLFHTQEEAQQAQQAQQAQTFQETQRNQFREEAINKQNKDEERRRQERLAQEYRETLVGSSGDKRSLPMKKYGFKKSTL